MNALVLIHYHFYSDKLPRHSYDGLSTYSTTHMQSFKGKGSILLLLWSLMLWEKCLQCRNYETVYALITMENSSGRRTFCLSVLLKIIFRGENKKLLEVLGRTSVSRAFCKRGIKHLAMSCYWKTITFGVTTASHHWLFFNTSMSLRILFLTYKLSTIS